MLSVFVRKSCVFFVCKIVYLSERQFFWSLILSTSERLTFYFVPFCLSACQLDNFFQAFHVVYVRKTFYLVPFCSLDVVRLSACLSDNLSAFHSSICIMLVFLLMSYSMAGYCKLVWLTIFPSFKLSFCVGLSQYMYITTQLCF